MGLFILVVNSSTTVTYLVLFDSLNNPMRWVEASSPFDKEDMLRESMLLFGNPDPLISDPVAFPTNSILENIFLTKIWNKSAGLYHNPHLYPHATFSGLEQKCLLCIFGSQHFAITGSDYKLNENLHWIINRSFGMGITFLDFKKNYNFSQWLLFITKIHPPFYQTIHSFSIFLAITICQTLW